MFYDLFIATNYENHLNGFFMLNGYLVIFIDMILKQFGIFLKKVMKINQ